MDEEPEMEEAEFLVPDLYLLSNNTRFTWHWPVFPGNISQKWNLLTLGSGVHLHDGWQLLSASCFKK